MDMLEMFELRPAANDNELLEDAPLPFLVDEGDDDIFDGFIGNK